MGEIATAEDAVKRAESFLSPYYLFRRLDGVKKTGGIWVVQFDVSLLGPPLIAVLKFDAKTGGLIEYDKGK